MTDLNIKLLIVGDSNVGKTSILSQYLEVKFPSDHVATIGVEYRIKMFNYNNFKIKLQIWDTAGQERFHSITNNFFRKADGILFVFDISDHVSFEGVKRWVNEAEEIGENYKQLLIGNKCDLSKRDINEEELKKFCDEKNIEYFEVSAKENINIKELFNKIVELLLKDKDDNEIIRQYGDSCSFISVTTGKNNKKIKKSKYNDDNVKCC